MTKESTIHRHLTAVGLIMTVGIVFGDIGTSPLYVMKAITGVKHDFNADYIIGAVSCIIWTLTLQTTVKYVLLALRADNKGEGGILALFALLRRLPRRGLYIVASVGAAALVADGMITPAVTVTSAVEGIRLVAPHIEVTPIVIFVILSIFIIQQAGTKVIGRFFGPYMLAWFLFLGTFGTIAMTSHPAILKAFNPWCAVRMLFSSPEWFLIMGAVFLCTTGAEALYSDLGHCGRRNITVSWIFVKAMLILNYLGQGAWLIAHRGEAEAWSVNPFFAIIPGSLTVIAVIISTGAAIIASQALLSGSFTIFSEAVNLDFWPKLKIKYPSDVKGQLYIPAINWALLAGCLLTVVIFRDSSHMEAAYGLAITVAMLMTTILLALWMRSRGVATALCIAFFTFFVVLEGLFFTANMFKFMHGGWYTLLIAGLVAFVMIVWHKARSIRVRYIDYKPLAECAPILMDIRADRTIARYASNLVFLSYSSRHGMIESKVLYSIVNKSPKRADHYWFLHIDYVDSPDTLEYTVDIFEPDAIYMVTMRLGFRVEAKVSVYLRQVIEDLVAAGRVDLTSRYPSLSRRDIAGDFRFVILHRVFSVTSNCKGRQAFFLKLYDRFRSLGISDRTVYGLDTSIFTCETVPLIINNARPVRIRPVSAVAEGGIHRRGGTAAVAHGQDDGGASADDVAAGP